MATQPRDEGSGVQDGTDGPASGLSRRRFLTTTGLIAGAAVIPGCTDRAGTPVPAEGSAAVPQPGLDVPENTEGRTRGALGRFLDPQQLAIVSAIAAQVIPGDEEDPGAVQAGSVEYIDRLLATHDGYPERTYTDGPFAVGYEGEEPEPEDGVIWVPEDELERYGWQSGLPPREMYRMGLARLDALAEQRDGSGFADLDEDQQIALLEALEDGEDEDVADTFEPLDAGTFFDLVRRHVIEGFLSDPIYGGNRGLVGWEHTRFPGSQRGYSPSELLDPAFSRPPQGIDQLPMMHGSHRADEHAHGGEALGSIRRRHPNGPVD